MPTSKAPFFASASAYRRIHCRRGGASAVWTYGSGLLSVLAAVLLVAVFARETV